MIDDKKRNLYKELKDYDYILYLETIEKANTVIESIRCDLINGKSFDDVSIKIESFLVERTLQLKNKY